MSAILKLVDEHFGKGRDDPFELHLASEQVTARELIAKRISDEIALLEVETNKQRQAHNRTRSFLIRFDPGSPEAQLNAPLQQNRKLARYNREDEVAAAIAGFETNKFVMLFDDQQVDDLDAPLAVTPQSELIFLRLVPLIGG